MTWSLEQAYDVYPQIEEEFSAALDQSLHPRGPDLLFDLVARLGLAPGAVAFDVGCGEGRQAVALHRRFGFRVTGIDPVPRHIELARAAAGQDGPAFAVGTADAVEHLLRSGAAISALVAGLSADDLAAGDGRVRLFAQIAIRHADNHRTDIETALAAQGVRRG